VRETHGLPSYLRNGQPRREHMKEKKYAPDTRYANHGFVKVIVRVDTIGSIEHCLDKWPPRMNIDHLPKSTLKLAWLAPWSFGCVTVLEYLFITGFSSLIGEHDENALEDACRAYFLELQAKYFDMSVTVYPARQSNMAGWATRAFA